MIKNMTKIACLCTGMMILSSAGFSVQIDRTGPAVLQGATMILTTLTPLQEWFKQQKISTENLLEKEHVILRNKGLKALPEDIGNLIRLTTLNVSNNDLPALPESIGKLENLRNFYAFHNDLQEIPSSLTKLTNLKFLSVSNNRLTKLPSKIGDLKALETLDVSYNLLKELPKNIGRLTSLKELHLQGNPLKALRSSMEKLSNLQSISFSESVKNKKVLKKCPQLTLIMLYNDRGELARTYEGKAAVQDYLAIG